MVNENTLRNIFDVQRAVRVVLDQNKITDQLIAVGDVDTLAIDDMIRDAIPRAIRAVLLVAPGVMIDDAVSGVVEGEGALTMLTLSEDCTFKGAQNTNLTVYAGTRVKVLNDAQITLSSDGAGPVTVSKFMLLKGTVIGNSKGKQVETTEDEDVSASTKGYLSTQGAGMSAKIEGDIAEGFYASINLPDNFLRLLSLKMSDWDYAIDHATPRGDTTYAIQHSNVYSLRGNPHRPVACITPDGRTLEAFSCGANATLTSFDYVAIPEIDTSNNTIPISDKLYPSVIYYCASLVCTSLGDFNKAQAMERIAMQYVTVNTNTNREVQSE